MPKGVYPVRESAVVKQSPSSRRFYPPKEPTTPRKFRKGWITRRRAQGA